MIISLQLFDFQNLYKTGLRNSGHTQIALLVAIFLTSYFAVGFEAFRGPLPLQLSQLLDAKTYFEFVASQSTAFVIGTVTGRIIYVFVRSILVGARSLNYKFFRRFRRSYAVLAIICKFFRKRETELTICLIGITIPFLYLGIGHAFLFVIRLFFVSLVFGIVIAIAYFGMNIRAKYLGSYSTSRLVGAALLWAYFIIPTYFVFLSHLRFWTLTYHTGEIATESSLACVSSPFATSNGLVFVRSYVLAGELAYSPKVLDAFFVPYTSIVAFQPSSDCQILRDH